MAPFLSKKQVQKASRDGYGCLFTRAGPREFFQEPESAFLPAVGARGGVASLGRTRWFISCLLEPRPGFLRETIPPQVQSCPTQDSLHFPGFSGCIKGCKRYMTELSWALLLYFYGFQDT